MFFEFDHAVPELRGGLEIEVCRRLAHLLFDVGDEPGEFPGIHGFGVLLKADLLSGDLFGDGNEVADSLADGLGRDAVFLVVFLLDRAASLCLPDGAAHGVRHVVRVHDDVAVGVSRGSADRLDQGCLGAQKALLVGVDDGDKGDLGYVETLPQEVDSDQHIKDIQTHVPDDLGPLQGIYIGVEVFDPDPGAGQVVGQVLRHFLGQGGDQHLVVPVGLFADLADQVVDLALHGADVNFRIEEACGTDDLLGAQELVLFLIGAGGGGDKQHLVDM